MQFLNKDLNMLNMVNSGVWCGGFGKRSSTITIVVRFPYTPDQRKDLSPFGKKMSAAQPDLISPSWRQDSDLADLSINGKIGVLPPRWPGLKLPVPKNPTNLL